MKTTLSRLIIVASLVAPAIVAAACKTEDSDDKESGPKLDIGANVALKVGEQVKLTATLKNEDGTTEVVTSSPQTVWSIDNSRVAMVIGGVVSGVDAGTTTVQASFNGLESAARKVTVK